MNARREAIEEYQKQRMFARLELQTQRKNAKMNMKEFQNNTGKFPGSNNLYNNYARQVNNSIEPNKVVNQFKKVYSNALKSEANESAAREKFMSNQNKQFQNALQRAQENAAMNRAYANSMRNVRAERQQSNRRAAEEAARAQANRNAAARAQAERNAAARAQAKANRNARAKTRRNRFFQYFKRKPSNARAPPPSQAPPSGQFTPIQLKLLNTVLQNIAKIANRNEPYAREAKRRHNILLGKVGGKNNIFLTKLTKEQLQKYRNNLNQILHPAYALPLQVQAHRLPLASNINRAKQRVAEIERQAAIEQREALVKNAKRRISGLVNRYKSIPFSNQVVQGYLKKANNVKNTKNAEALVKNFGEYVGRELNAARKPTRRGLLGQEIKRHPAVRIPKRVRTTWWKLF